MKASDPSGIYKNNKIVYSKNVYFARNCQDINNAWTDDRKTFTLKNVNRIMFIKKFFNDIWILSISIFAGGALYLLQKSYGIRHDFIVLLFFCGFILLIAYFLYVLKNPTASLPFIIYLSFLVFVEPAPFDILTILALLALVLNRIVRSEKALQISLVEFFLILFILSNLSNVLMSYDKALGVKHFAVTLFMGAIFIFIAKLSDSEKIIDYQLSLFLVPGIITSIAMILGYLSSNLNFNLGPLNDIIIEEGRPRAFFKDSNVAGPFLILSAVYSLANFLNHSAKNKLKYLFLFLLFGLGIFLTFSRGALLALIFSTILLITLNLSLKRFLKLSLFLMLSAFPVLIFVNKEVKKEHISHRIFDIKFGVQDRFQRIENGLSDFKKSPLIGTGMRLPFSKAPHDSYFLLLTQQGLVGFLCFWIPILYIVYRLLFTHHEDEDIRRKIISTTLGVTLLSHIILGLVIYFLHWRHFWFITGLSVGYLHTFKPNRATNE